ncbi:unnamed protein product [Gadus morhua 'NCC']
MGMTVVVNVVMWVGNVEVVVEVVGMVMTAVVKERLSVQTPDSPQRRSRDHAASPSRNPLRSRGVVHGPPTERRPPAGQRPPTEQRPPTARRPPAEHDDNPTPHLIAQWDLFRVFLRIPPQAVMARHRGYGPAPVTSALLTCMLLLLLLAPPPALCQQDCTGVTCPPLSHCIQEVLESGACCPTCARTGCACEGYQYYDCLNAGFKNGKVPAGDAYFVDYGSTECSCPEGGGRISCSYITCPDLPANCIQTSAPADACAHCERVGCVHGASGQKYDAGHSFHVDACDVCHCPSGGGELMCSPVPDCDPRDARLPAAAAPPPPPTARSGRRGPPDDPRVAGFVQRRGHGGGRGRRRAAAAAAAVDRMLINPWR